MKEGSFIEKNGILTYVLAIKAASALNMSLRFSEYNLSQNSLLSIFTKHELTDSITSKENNPKRFWATKVYQGNTLFIVLKTPRSEINEVSVKIGTIFFGFKDFGERFGHPGASANCNINIACPLGIGWEAERNSVAIMTDGSGNGSGVMVMNTCNANIPYFLTAKHVLDQAGDPAHWVIQFFYFSTACNTNTGYREDVQFNGAVALASYGPSYFALLRLNQTPAANSGICYSGWNRSLNIIWPTTGIHHPNHDVMKISRDNGAPTRYIGSMYAPGTHWQVTWDQGITAVGSSGSPLYDLNHRIIGQLHDGLSYCSTPHDPDWYGSFDASWTGGGTNTTRLSNWLDPSNSGATTTNTTNVSLLFGNYVINGPSSFCTSDAYYVPNLPAGATVNWSVNPSYGVVSLTPNGTQVTVTKSNAGLFDLTATITYCGNTTTVTRNSITAGVPLDGAVYAAAGQNLQLKSWAEGANLIWEDSWVYWGLTGTVASQYSLVGGNTSTAWPVTDYFPNVTFYMDPSNYLTFEVATSNGSCQETLHYTFVAIQNPNSYGYYSLAPNPVSSDLTIYVDEEKLKKEKIEKSPDQVIQQVIVLDKFGKVMMQQSYAPNSQKVTLNVSRLPVDMYVVRIYNGKQWIPIKFFKK